MALHAPQRTRPRMVCPCCRTDLDGGPIRYRCPQCRRGLSAADAVPEVAPPAAPEPVTFLGEVRKGLPGVLARTAIAAAAVELGYAVHEVASALGVAL